jgi:predicted permease
MSAILAQLAPIFVYFGLGVLLKRLSVADASHGDFLLRLAFFVTLPLLILISLSKTPLTFEKAILPVANIAVNLACMLTTLGLSRLLVLDRKTTGTMLINTMIVNNAFMFPFILAVYGERGFSDAILFDFGNAMMVATYTYAVAFKYGGQRHSSWTMLIKVLKAPLFWALAVAVGLSLTGTALPKRIEVIIGPLAQMTSPLILISLGIFFSLKIAELRLVTLAVVIRMVLGLIFGVVIATLLGLEGTTFVVISLCAAAPIGFMALTFSSLAKLDIRLSSSAVSISILVGLIYIPILILFFGIH